MSPERSQSAYASLEHFLADVVAILRDPFFDPQQGANTNVVLRARDAQKLALAKRAVEEMLERVRRAQSNSA